MQEEASTPDTETGESSFREIIESKNLYNDFTKEQIAELAEQVSAGFEYDKESRKEFERTCIEATKLAIQIKEQKSYPWIGAANVKYPLLSTAAMQFNARAYPSLVPSSGEVVKTVVVGKDPTGEKLERAKRVSTYMSYQLLHQMRGWEEDMDRLLLILPIVGTCFKKTYWDSVAKKNVSKLVLPMNLVVDYWTNSLDEAERISEIIYLTKRVVKSRQMAGLFADVELPDPVNIDEREDLEPRHQYSKPDEAMPYQFIEQHCYYDKDGDGYPEPYIVTFERSSKTIVRIVARFDDEGVVLNDENKLVEIRPIQYYTKYGFVPNPDGGFYDMGFGVLLGPLNESVNTLINQIIDAGHLYNLQGGFLGKGLKLKMGEQTFRPGEWKTVNSTADDLKKQVMMIPAREPSSVLYQLLGTLITSGKELASVAEIFVGKMPGQNTPATTTMATIEQGMKVFTAVYKRIYRSLSDEFNKLFDLNKTYSNPTEYAAVVDVEVKQEDWDRASYDICPGADPNAMSQTEKLMKAQGLLELLPIGTLDPVEVTIRILEAQEQPNYQKVLNKQIQQTGEFQPPPDPKMLEMQMKGQMDERAAAIKDQAQQRKMELDGRAAEQKMNMKAQEHVMDMQQKHQQAMVETAGKIHMQRIFERQTAAEGAQKMIQSDQQHQQKLQQMKETSKSQQNKQSQTGGKTRSR